MVETRAARRYRVIKPAKLFEKARLGIERVDSLLPTTATTPGENTATGLAALLSSAAGPF
jgi:hypothetical protein